MESRLRPSPDTVAQRVGDEIVLVHLKSDRIFTLNRTGARVWELLSESCDRAEIQERLLHDFEVDECRLEKEIEDLLDSLFEQDLLVISNE